LDSIQQKCSSEKIARHFFLVERGLVVPVWIGTCAMLLVLNVTNLVQEGPTSGDCRQLSYGSCLGGDGLIRIDSWLGYPIRKRLDVWLIARQHALESADQY